MQCKKEPRLLVSELPVAAAKKSAPRLALASSDYAQLASFRHALRAFLHFSEASAAEEGLTSQHYQAMLCLRGWPAGRPVSIGELAQQLLIKHNSAVGLVDRLVHEGLVVREHSAVDRRKVELHLSPHGRQVLARLAAMHRDELRRIGPFMRRFFSELAQGAALTASSAAAAPGSATEPPPRSPAARSRPTRTA